MLARGLFARICRGLQLSERLLQFGIRRRYCGLRLGGLLSLLQGLLRVRDLLLRRHLQRITKFLKLLTRNLVLHTLLVASGP